MKLILFGGVQGVGKSTLLSHIFGKEGSGVKFLDPGELFRRYFYKEKLKTIEEIEELIVSELVNAPKDSVILAHWHYAVPRPDGYIPQVDFSRVERIAGAGNIDQVVLVSVEAPVEAIYERRSKDQMGKKRNLSKELIREEISRDGEFLETHRAIFSGALGEERVFVHHISNIDLDMAKKALCKEVGLK